MAHTAATRRYIYCIIDCPEPTTFGPMGVGNDAEVFALPYEGIAAVVSSTATEKFEISRENTLAHQRVMEAVMQRGHTVLPVRFDTIAEDKPDGAADAESRIVNHVLVQRRDEFKGLLALFRDRVELGVKGLWVDMNAVFAEIVRRHDDIRLLRKRALDGASPRLAGMRSGGLPLTARLGELVKNALEAKKSAAEAELLNHLAGTILEACKNKAFGDPMFANLALLVNKSRQDDLGAALTKFEDEQAGKVRLKYVGPVPPSNFIELVITWDD
ncbi:MAG: GvpL/GvpF family gas vesicle protein [Planctomycetota bacterium]